MQLLREVRTIIFRVTEIRMIEIRAADLRVSALRAIDLRVTEPRVIVLRAAGFRVTDRPARDRAQGTDLRMGSTRIAEVVRMADREATETGRTTLIARGVRAVRAVRAIAAAVGIMQVLAAALTVAAAITEAMQGRELTEDLRAKLPRKIWKRSAMTTRGASAASGTTSAPRKITFMRKKRR